MNDENDENAEVWYLLGLALNNFDPDNALDCLRKSKEVLSSSSRPSTFFFFHPFSV